MQQTHSQPSTRLLPGIVWMPGPERPDALVALPDTLCAGSTCTRFFRLGTGCFKTGYEEVPALQALL
jgi:hypothetical protein